MIKYTSVDDVYLHDDLVSDPAIKQGLIERAVGGSEGYQVMPDDNGVMGAYAVSPDGKHIPLGKVDDVLLASADTGITTDGGAYVGTRLNMPKGLNTPENMQAVGNDIPKTVAGVAKGMAQGFVGLPGDLEGIGRLVLNYMGADVNEQTKLPTTQDVKGFLDQYIKLPELQTGDMSNFETAGEWLAPGGQLKAIKPVAKALKGAVKMTEGLPVGLSTKAVGEGVDDLGFYSAAAKAVDAIQQPKGTGEQFLAQITKTPGVKQDEIMWTGLDDFLKSKKTVTKQEVQDYLANNRVEIKEVQLGNQEKFDANKLSELEAEYKNLKQHPIDDPGFGEDKYDEMIKLMNIRDRSTTDSLYASAESATRAAQRAQSKGMKDTAEKYFKEAELFNTRAEKLDLNDLGMENPTKYEKYTLPGGENYREVLLTLPSKNPEFDPKDIGRLNDLSNKTRTPAEDMEYKALAQRYDASLRGETSPEFKSNHFDQPNILAHLRVDDRIDAEGKKVLMVEEVQSDWHQAGRKQGYKDPAIKDEYQALEKELMAVNREALPYTSKGEDAPQNLIEKKVALSERMDALDKKYNNGVPDAPFKTTWSELAMKRAIQMAAEGGYDRIAFTTGKTQAERFDLSKQIDELMVTKNPDGTFSMEATLPNGGGVQTVGEDIPADKLDDIVGKDLASTIRKQESKGDVYSADDLRIGGEGMKGFYDNILPKFLDKYSKKWEAKTGMTEIPVGKGKPTDYADFNEWQKTPSQSSVGVHYIDITPKMRESVVTKGQPMFAIGAGGAGAATQQNQENK